MKDKKKLTAAIVTAVVAYIQAEKQPKAPGKK
jgi:hypothetical protein